jgi:chromosome segregation ATPase
MEAISSMTDGQEINILKLEVSALKQQLHTERESLKKEADELMIKKIDYYEKELALVREDAQVEILRLEKRNLEHQKLNGKLREEYTALTKANQNLREKIEQYEDQASHYRRKAVL